MPVRIALAVVACASLVLAGDLDVKSLDHNKDGRIDKEELTPLLQALNDYNGGAETMLDANTVTKSVVVLGSGVAPSEFRLLPGTASQQGPSPIAQAGDHIRGLMKTFLEFYMKTNQPERMEEVAHQMVRVELIFAEAEIHYRSGNLDKALALMRSVIPSEGGKEHKGVQGPPGKDSEHDQAVGRVAAALKEVCAAMEKIEGEMKAAKKRYGAEDLTDQQRERVENAMADMKARLETLRAQRKDLEAKLKALQGK